MLKKQATFYRDLQQKFLWLWKDVPSYVSRMQEIIANPSVARLGELEKQKVHPVQVQYYRHLIDITLKLSVYKFTVRELVYLS